MKFKNLLLVAIFYSNIWAYDSIDEALENGISSGDITFYGSYTNGADSINKAKNDLNESGYMVGSVGLAYHSAFWK